MTRQQLEEKLNSYGSFKRVYADSDKIVYVPAEIAEKLRKDSQFKEFPEDTLFNSLRHQNIGKAFVAFQY